MISNATHRDVENKTAPMQVKIQLATSQHLEQIVCIIRQTAKWLKTKGINQWSENFPISRLEDELLNGELFYSPWKMTFYLFETKV